VVVGILIVFVFTRLMSYHKVTITDDALTQQTLGSGKETVFFKDVYKVREQFDITLITSQRSISLTKNFLNYTMLYRLLRKKISPSAFNDHLDFPWKLQTRSRLGYGKKSREILLTEEQIIVRQNNRETIWPLDQIERIYLQNRTKYSHGIRKNALHAVIKTTNEVTIKITPRQARELRLTPEHIVANLHRLYPQTAPIIENSLPSLDMLIQQGQALFAGGNMEKAISLYKQVTAIDRYQWQAWQQLGLCHLQLGNFQEATTAFRDAVTLNNHDVTSFYNGAIAFSQMGNRIIARVYLKEALALQPELKSDIEDSLVLKGVLD